MDESDLYGLSFDDEGTAAEKAQALAAALLRTKQLGNTDTLIGGQLAGLGNQEAQQYNQGQQSLLKAGENRLLRNTEATRNAALAQYHNDTIAQRQLEEDRKRAKDEAPEFKTAGDKESGYFDPKAKTFTPLVDAPKKALGGTGGPSIKQQTLEERMAKQLATYLQKGDGSHQFQQDLEKRAAAQNLKALDEGGGRINPAMVQEATMALARLVQGGSPTEGTLLGMVPHTAGMDLAKALQYVTDAPQDAGAQQFIKYMMQTADREQKLSEQRILQARLEGVRASGLRKVNPDRFRQIISPYFDEGMVDTYDGTPTGLAKVQAGLAARPGAAAPKAAPGADKLAKAQKWLADPKNANDPNRAAVEATVKRFANGG